MTNKDKPTVITIPALEEDSSIPMPTQFTYDEENRVHADYAWMGKEIKCPHCNESIVLDMWGRFILAGYDVHKSEEDRKKYAASLPRI